MECSLYNNNFVIRTSAFFPRTPENINCLTFPSTCSFPLNSRNPLTTLSSSSSAAVKCYGQNYADEEPLSASLAYDVLGVAPNCSADELKSAFRNKVKKFHPDVRRNGDSSDKMICRVIQAYEILSNFTKSEIIERLMFSCHIHCLSSAENAWIHFISQNVKHLISLLMRPCVLEKVAHFHVLRKHLKHSPFHL